MQENEKTTPPGEVGFLDYDPIICAQDWPESMARASVVLVKNTETEASVKVDLWGKKSAPPLMVKLKKLPDGWRIDAIVCGRRFRFIVPSDEERGKATEKITILQPANLMEE